MNRPPPIAMIQDMLRGIVPTLAVVTLLSPCLAQAGIGNPLKKAEEKAAQAVGKKEPPPPAAADKPVVFDDVILELNGDRLDRIVAAFKGAAAAGAGRPALVEKLNHVNEERSKINDKHGEEMRLLRNKRSDVETCLHDAYQEAFERRSQEYREKALTDPVIREKFARAAQEHNEAASRGDSTALQKLNEVLQSEVLPTHQDSVQAQQTCGPVPPPSQAERRLAELDKEDASLSEQIRLIDKKVAAAQAEGVQMNEQQFGMATERIQMYLSWRQSKSYSKSSTRGFTEAEIEAMEKRLKELRAALG